MIKTTLGTIEPAQVKCFPKLMRGRDGLIVLFKEHGYGMVIHGGDSEYKDNIGHHTVIWDMKNFIDYNEPITLQNQ